MEQRNSKQTNNAQEVQEDSADIKAAAAKITGKPAAEISQQEAEAALFSEIGSSERPPADKEKAMQAAADAIHAQEVQEMAKDTPQEKATQILKKQAAAGKEPRDLLNTVYALSFIMDYMKDPVDALTAYNLLGTEKILPDLLKNQFIKLVKKTADAIGADPAQIAGQEQLARLEAFIDSNYMQALQEVAKLEVTAPTLKEHEADAVRHYAVLYFFALHFPDIRPDAQQTLTEAQLSEIRGILARFDKFIANRAADMIEGHFKAFIEKDSKELEKVRKNLPRIMGATPDSLDYPIDKINNNVWDLLDDAAKDANGQFHFAMEKRGHKEATIIYSIDFDALERLENVKITKHLTPFDKRVYIAVFALFKSTGEYMSAGQIYRMMGYTRNPGASDIQKINDSLTKMGAARIYLDNTQEITVNKGYAHFKYDAPLLPFERVEAYINNAFCESAIHIFREPPLMTFAQERRQITTIKRQLLESPVSKTEANLRIEDYLIDQISVMKNNSKYSRKMLYSTIYQKCKIATRMQRQRAPEKIKKFLDYYKACGWIKTYKEDDAGVTIEP